MNKDQLGAAILPLIMIGSGIVGIMLVEDGIYLGLTLIGCAIPIWWMFNDMVKVK